MSYEYITKYDSPNFGGFGVKNKPDGIVIHHWGGEGQNFESVIAWLCNPRAQVSAHYVVEAGKVACIVNCWDAAWHAGNRYYNTHSIGIECRPEMTDGDLNTLIELIADIYKDYGVLPLIGHKDIVNTACPGKYYSKLTYIQAKATELYKTGKVDNTIKPAPPKPVAPKKITEDGILGRKSVTAWQVAINATYKDGVISAQLVGAKPYVRNVTKDCWIFDNGGGSPAIKTWQTYLNNKTGAGLVVDGYCGDGTIKETQKFLNAEVGANLAVDGIIGYNTAKALQVWINTI